MTEQEQDYILVVDDEPDMLQLLTDVLSDNGFTVRSANTGALAIQSVADKLPNLILLDINMPDMGGFEVCRRLKADERSRNIPTIFISGTLNRNDKMQCFTLGAVDFISKPFQVDELLAMG